MKICIRVDGGSEIGMGHVMRTLALAKELEKKHCVFFACRIDNPLTDKYKPGIDLIKSNEFEIEYIPENNLKKSIQHIIADCVITDSYDVDEEYFNICKRFFNISGCLDDEKTCGYFNVDFLINQNLYAKDLNYKVNNDTKLMLGNKFIILRDEFRNISFSKNIKKEIKDIMITVGGSDNNNLTESIITQLNTLKYNLHIVIGKGFKYIENLKKYENENIKLYINTNMRNLMEKCDISIASCGTTIYELAVCQVPTIGIVVAENQKLAAETMDKLNIIKYCKIEDLYSSIGLLDYNTRMQLSVNSQNVVDGRGIYRIVDEIERIIKK